MNLSAILVVVPPPALEESIDRLNALEGIDVHHVDPKTGRMIITQEGPDIDAEVSGLKRIQELPHVVLAEMVEHHFDKENES